MMFFIDGPMFYIFGIARIRFLGFSQLRVGIE